MAEYKNPYEKHIKNPYENFVSKSSKSDYDKDRQQKLPLQYPERSSRPESAHEAELWKRVKQVWDDCQALGWDEEDTAEALFGIVEELTRTPEGSK